MTEKRPRFQALRSLIVTRILNALMQFGTIAVIAQSVSLPEFGGYAATVAVGSVLGGIFGFGLSTRVLRIQAESHRNVLLAASRLTAGSSILVGTLSYLYGVLLGSESFAWALAAGAYVASELFSNLMSSMLFGEQRRRRAELGLILRRALPLAMVLLAILFYPRYIFEFAAVGFALAALSLRLLVGHLPWEGWRFRELIGGSWQYWLTNIWTTLQQLDAVIVASVLGLSAAGGYGAAFRLASPIHIVTTSITSLLIPELSKIETPLARRRAARPYLLAGYGYSALIIACAPAAATVGPLLFGAQYEEFGLLFSILFVNSAFSVINQIQVARLYGEGQIAVVTWATAISTICGLSLLALGALVGGVVWAAVGYASSRLLLLAILSVQSTRRIGRD